MAGEIDISDLSPKRYHFNHTDYSTVLIPSTVYAEHLNVLRVSTCKKNCSLLLQRDWRNRACRSPHRNLKMCRAEFRSRDRYIVY